MSIKTVAVILLLLSITISAQHEIKRTGGVARVKSMGDNAFMVDPTNMLTNPAYGAYYDNLIWGDIGSNGAGSGFDNSNQYGSVNIRLDEDFTLGVMLANGDNNSKVAILHVDPLSLNGAGVFSVDLPRVSTELFGSYKMGNTVLGVGLAYAGSSIKFDKPDRNSHQYFEQFGLNVGVITKVSEKISVEGLVTLMLLNDKYSSSLSGVETEGSQTVIDLGARAFIPINGKVNFIPLVKFYTSFGKNDFIKGMELGYSDYDIPTNSQLDLGIGFDYKKDKLYLVGGPTLIYSSYETEKTEQGIIKKDDMSRYALAWNFGAEWNFAEWLIGRIGYSYLTEFITSESTMGANVTKYWGSSYSYYNGATVGIGFNFDDFSFDVTVNESILRQGLKNIGGNDDTFAYGSLSYAF